MMAIRKRLSGQKGFTLIELLVVVAILGILAGIAAPRVMDAIENAREKRDVADMTAIRDALERFYLDYNVFPTNLQDLVTMDYMAPSEYQNAYGNEYLYVVMYDLSDYRLGDPGQVPLDETTYPLPWVSSEIFPVGVPAGETTATTCYVWGDQSAVPAHNLPAVATVYHYLMDPTNTDKDYTPMVAAASIIFFNGAGDDDIDDPDATTGQAWAYTGQ